MSLKKMASILLSSLMITGLLAGCGTSGSTESNGKTEITFWSAPNPPQTKFWKTMASKFQKKNPNITVNVTQMKESPSSESTIQSAVASHTTPTLSENITRSFGAQLANSKAIIPLNKLSGISTVIKNRQMENTIKGWAFSDGNQYVLPVYSNPILFAWRLDTLKKLGYTTPPKTYSEVLKVGKKLKEKYPDKYMWAKPALADPTSWQRWFDFFLLYHAASNGNAYISGNRFVADSNAGKEVLSFMDQLRKANLLLTKQATDSFETGTALMVDNGPWSFPNWAEKYPQLQYGKTYTLSAPPVPDHMKNTSHPYTYADAKGIVIYANATTAQKKAAVKFMNFVFSNPSNDLTFLKTTNLIPARDNAATNAKFASFFKKNPALKVYAENVKYGVPAMDNKNYNDLMQAIGVQAFNPIVRGQKGVGKAWSDLVTAEKKALHQ
jgi:multiple sugar transport system substrate-binding protein